jgi:hypothetical protein
MALILRIDVDRPYGKSPVLRHLLSRGSSDLYLPKLEFFGYLEELKQMLEMLNRYGAQACIFFRRCTLPSKSIMRLIEQGSHEVGLHLENSRSWATFAKEKQNLERHVGKTVRAISKHGSGKGRYGFSHYAPYEPDKYVDWARRSGMQLFLGNLEDPTLRPTSYEDGLIAYPAGFWLEPHWRDTVQFPVEWLLEEAKTRDLVMLVHPENVLDSPSLTMDFKRVVSNLETKTLTPVYS